jgi:hypothetical protein
LCTSSSLNAIRYLLLYRESKLRVSGGACGSSGGGWASHTVTNRPKFRSAALTRKLALHLPRSNFRINLDRGAYPGRTNAKEGLSSPQAKCMYIMIRTWRANALSICDDSYDSLWVHPKPQHVVRRGVDAAYCSRQRAIILCSALAFRLPFLQYPGTILFFQFPTHLISSHTIPTTSP